MLEEEEGEGETAVTCLVMAQQEAQSLMVNRLVAAVAGHLVTEMVLRSQSALKRWLVEAVAGHLVTELVLRR